MTDNPELLVSRQPKHDGKQKGGVQMEKEAKGFGRRDFMKLGIGDAQSQERIMESFQARKLP